ncbi:MAG: PH domain-containing protein [Elusimicrobia bacterium]|nr:PH domain-containing protein [Elusimicrobiota bacterium]
MILYPLQPIYRNNKYILTDKKFILDSSNFFKSKIIYYDKIQKIELINKKIEKRFDLGTIKIFLKSSKIKNKFVVIPAVYNGDGGN